MTALTPDMLVSGIRKSQRDEPDSGILSAVNHGFGRKGLIPLWTGEGPLKTPEFICQAASRAMLNGETFYTWQRGIPQLRSALATYHEKFWPGRFSPERFFVTGGGMQAIQTALQLLADAGDEIVIPSPAWPNFPGPMRMMGVKPVFVPMLFDDQEWSLDLDRMRDAIGPRTRAICLISPSNPLGWVASRDDLIAIRDMAREAGVWILADEVYSRFYYGPDTGGVARSPSFMDVCEQDERVIYINTFSKNWAMTGWRIGWLQAPEALGAAIERIIQYNTSGTAAFMQKGALAALEDGEEFVEMQISMGAYLPRQSGRRTGPTQQCQFRKTRWAPSTASSALTGLPTASGRPYALSMKPMSAWPRAAHSDPGAKASCACATCAIRPVLMKHSTG